MTVFEMLNAILARYAGATPDAMASFKPVYYARFGKREGPHLQAAFDECCAAFKPTARQPFPIPADIEAFLPSIDRIHGGPKLDLKAHAERKRSLLEEWRRAQGFRGANGISQVMQALEFIAEPIAHQRAWRSDAEPVRLTRAQLMIAQQRAVSAERLVRHPLDRRADRMSVEPWWAQIDAIQQEWKIQLTLSDWTQKKPERANAA